MTTLLRENWSTAYHSSIVVLLSDIIH